MKTAEDWIAERIEWIKQSHPFLVHPEPLATVDFIKQIQLDAFKAGMTEAADIADKELEHNRHRTVSGVNAMRAILSARDNLKEI